MLSDYFWMVQLNPDKELPGMKDVAADGNYDPRVMFLDKFGRVATSLKNEEGPKKKQYFYANADELLKTMESLISRQKAWRRHMDEL